MSKVSITLAEAWTYRTPLTTIEYPAGRHDVAAEVRDAAEADGVTGKGKGNGDRYPEGGSAGDTDGAES